MYYITIDCGTTNSRVYVVDEKGNVCGKAVKKVGVRDTAVSGTKQVLEDGLRETITKAVEDAGLQLRDMKAIFSSGMITSEIGLYELPHLTAPCNVEALADNITQVPGLHLTDREIPVYFVRGIKNRLPEMVDDPFAEVGNADFMRGEETQMAGILANNQFTAPFTVVVLSSHTKFIPVNKDGMIMGSLTTLSGQAYEAILSQTFVGKSVEKRENTQELPQDYFDENVVNKAAKWCKETGILRSLMFPRFLEVLLDTKWYERKLFFEAMVAAEDMKAVSQLETMCGEIPKRFILVGLPERCKLYEHVLKQNMKDLEIILISDVKKVDALSIDGILDIAKKAGVIS